MASGGRYFDSAYFAWQADRAARSAREVVPLLLELVAPKSVVDVGSGPGAWLQVFTEHGVADVVGIDGDYIDGATLRIPADRFIAADLAALPELPRTFDLALSLEAAHYAPESAAAGIVDALTSYAPVVYFAAAIPGQPGGPTLNRQWPRYWSDLFAAREYRCADVLRAQLWERDGVDWWYAQNGLLFLREGAAGPAATGSPLPLVHPLLFAEVSAAEPAAEAPRRRLRLRR
jgi:SAM-dependent methyltransferase